ncbi:hypothetical protein E0Z10_g8857 [Xylaria hypoxylon]|uniref:Uncharacterized protein n=1 Tax=Xylaria hypoxylon TaxID=37992 RepID=A0A4Z0YMP4_9PEZI|nr:hypothetical protein E0Z10_g8857 [Xylaria hypoxylon]
MLDPGTVLSVIQLSGTVLKLGRDIAFEFVGPEGAPKKLKHLNSRLQTLNTLLEEILEQPGSPEKLSTTKVPGSVSIEKTLKECKTFLEHYKSLLAENPSRSATAQRVLLTVGPDASRIDEFHKKIDQHYTEIGQWRLGSLNNRIYELHMLVTSIRDSISVPPTNHPPLCTVPNSGPVTPLIGTPPKFYTITTPSNLLADQQLLSPTIYTSPVLRAQSSRTPSLISIPELPPAAIHSPSLLINQAPLHNKRSVTSESGSVIGLIGRQSYDTSVGGSRTSSSSLNRPLSGHRITLVLGTEEGLQFSPDAYEVHEGETGRIIDWVSSQIRVRHFLPQGISRIPYTKPNDPKMEVTFLPLGSKHRFEITTGDGSESKHDKFKYQFTHRLDREMFQRRVRIRQSLQMVQVVRIHKSKEENIAMDVHLKVWARNEHDTDPTFSFAYLGKHEPNHHVEYIIRWFKKDPERKGAGRLILRPYSEDTDLFYGPAVDDSNRRNSTFKDLRRKMSISSNASLGSRSPSMSNPPAVMYEGKGEIAPEHVRRLGHLDIEFESMGLREKFINACYEAHHPARILRRATFGSDTDPLSPKQASIFSSRSPSMSQATTPQRSISEQEGVGLGVDMGAPGHVPASPNLLQLPSPALPRTSGIRFDTLSLFTMPDPAIPTACELESSEPSPTDTQNQGDIR